jgi:hypothetical protein
MPSGVDIDPNATPPGLFLNARNYKLAKEAGSSKAIAAITIAPAASHCGHHHSTALPNVLRTFPTPELSSGLYRPFQNGDGGALLEL